MKYVSLFLLLVFVGCGGGGNVAPVAKIIASETVLSTGQVLNLDGGASVDSDGVIARYAWLDSEGKQFSAREKTTWVAPDTLGKYTLTLRVTDDANETANTHIVVDVNNHTPRAKIVVGQPTLFVGSTMYLDANQSTDADAETLQYTWFDENHLQIGKNVLLRWVPQRVGNYKFTLQVKDEKGVIDTASIRIRANKALTAFSYIQDLIASKRATYICVGDSTRSGPKSPFDDPDRNYDGQFIFDFVTDTLAYHGLTSHLYAREGHQAKQFNMATKSPTWRDVVALIPADGDEAIVDISLGINDLFSDANAQDGSASVIKRDLKEAIEKILAVKPKTHFLLTSPNPQDTIAASSSVYNARLIKVYTELSRELDIPLIDVLRSDIPFTHDRYVDDSVHFHLGQSAQRDIAELILEKILP